MLLHYFPPNPVKLGDNLLTEDIAREAAHHYQIVYYATPFICEVLQEVISPSFCFEKIFDLCEAAEIAAALRKRNKERCLDLFRLNGWIDYPELRSYFGDVPERCHHDWFSQAAISRYGLSSFSNIFRQIVAMPPSSSLFPPLWKKEKSQMDFCVIAPHCETDFQQLPDWPLLAKELGNLGWNVVIVGKKVVQIQFEWPDQTSFALDLSGTCLVDLLMKAELFLGGATGVTHLADILGVPSYGLWKKDDLTVFGPRRASTVTVLVDTCAAFLSAYTMPSPMR